MTIVQLMLLEPQKASRSVRRRPFTPSDGGGPYQLPKAIRDRLTAVLAAYRNAEAAYLLAVLIGRYWSTPSRITGAFPLDRRALAGHPDLDGMSESRIRGAIRTLERVGFIDRAIPAPGSQYRLKGDELHRKPVLFQLGKEYGPEFVQANRRAQAARERRKFKDPRMTSTTSALMGSASSNTTMMNSPKSRIEAEAKVLMGDQSSRAPTSEPIPQVEAALKRFEEAFRRRAAPDQPDSRPSRLLES
jgi:hypothetical protein